MSRVGIATPSRKVKQTFTTHYSPVHTIRAKRFFMECLIPNKYVGFRKPGESRLRISFARVRWDCAPSNPLKKDADVSRSPYVAMLNSPCTSAGGPTVTTTKLDAFTLLYYITL